MADERVSYTAKDYESIKEFLLEKKVPELTDDWTDFRESDLGVILVELMSYLGDMIFYSIDREILERFLETAQEKKNVRANLKNLGYKIPTYQSAEVECEFYTTHNKDVEIPKYLELSTIEEDGESIPYVVYPDSDEDEIHLSSETYVDINTIQGEVVNKSFDNTDVGNLNRIPLSKDHKNIAEGTIELEVDGEDWTEVDDVLMYRESGRFFSMGFDKEDRVYVELSPTWENYVRDESDVEFEVTYILSMGEDGVVGRHKIKNIEGDIYDIDGEEVSGEVVVDNNERSSGGEDPQDIEEAKKMGPEVIKTMWTAVTPEDYEILSKDFAGVSRALAIDWGVAEEEELNAEVELRDVGILEISVDEYGEDGNNYSVEVVADEGDGYENLDLEVEMEDDYKLRIRLATDENGELDPDENIVSIIADKIDSDIEGLSAREVSSGELESSEEKDFEGGFGPSDPYEIYVYIVPNEGGDLTDSFKNELNNYFSDRKVATVDCEFKDAEYEEIDIDAEVFIGGDYSSSSVRVDVEDSIDEFFDYDNRDFSETILYTDILRVIEDANEDIERVELYEPESNIVLDYGKFPVKGEVTLGGDL